MPIYRLRCVYNRDIHTLYTWFFQRCIAIVSIKFLNTFLLYLKRVLRLYKSYLTKLTAIAAEHLKATGTEDKFQWAHGFNIIHFLATSSISNTHKFVLNRCTICRLNLEDPGFQALALQGNSMATALAAAALFFLFLDSVLSPAIQPKAWSMSDWALRKNIRSPRPLVSACILSQRPPF